MVVLASWGYKAAFWPVVGWYTPIEFVGAKRNSSHCWLVSFTLQGQACCSAPVALDSSLLSWARRWCRGSHACR